MTTHGAQRRGPSLCSRDQLRAATLSGFIRNCHQLRQCQDPRQNKKNYDNCLIARRHKIKVGYFRIMLSIFLWPGANIRIFRQENQYIILNIIFLLYCLSVCDCGSPAVRGWALRKSVRAASGAVCARASVPRPPRRAAVKAHAWLTCWHVLMIYWCCSVGLLAFYCVWKYLPSFERLDREFYQHSLRKWSHWISEIIFCCMLISLHS